MIGLTLQEVNKALFEGEQFQVHINVYHRDDADDSAGLFFRQTPMQGSLKSAYWKNIDRARVFDAMERNKPGFGTVEDIFRVRPKSNIPDLKQQLIKMLVDAQLDAINAGFISSDIGPLIKQAVSDALFEAERQFVVTSDD